MAVGAEADGPTQPPAPVYQPFAAPGQYVPQPPPAPYATGQAFPGQPYPSAEAFPAAPAPQPVSLPSMQTGFPGQTSAAGHYGHYDAQGVYIPGPQTSTFDNNPEGPNSSALWLVIGAIVVLVVLVGGGLFWGLSMLNNNSDAGAAPASPSASHSPSTSPKPTPSGGSNSPSDLPAELWRINVPTLMDTRGSAWIDDVQSIDGSWFSLTTSSDRGKSLVSRANADGSIAWKTSMASNTFCAPQLLDDSLVCLTPWSVYGQVWDPSNTTTNSIFKLNASTGEASEAVSVDTELEAVPVAQYGGVLYLYEAPSDSAADTTAYLDAVDTATGKVLWRNGIGDAGGAIDAAFGDTWVVAATASAQLRMFDRATGEERSIPDGTTMVYPLPHGAAFLNPTAHMVSATADDGTALWQAALPDLSDVWDTTVPARLMGNQAAYVMGPETKFAHILAELDTDSAPSGGQGGDNGARVAYSGSNTPGLPLASGTIATATVLDLSTGQVRWTYESKNPLGALTQLSDDTYVVEAYSLRGASLVSLNAGDGAEGWRADLPAFNKLDSVGMSAESIVAVQFAADDADPMLMLTIDPSDGTVTWNGQVDDVASGYYGTHGLAGVQAVEGESELVGVR